MQSDREEIEALMRENADMERRLTAAGNGDFEPMLGLCSDLTGILEEVSEISGKRSKIEHAALDTKLKFSRKVRRKAKDIGRFEETLVHEFDSGHIELELGRRMVAVLKLLKSNSIGKAGEKAKEFHELLEIGGKLKSNKELLLKKRAQIERGRRDLACKLSCAEWLEKQASPNPEKIERHRQRLQLLDELRQMRRKCISVLISTPLPELAKKAREEQLELIGFPTLSENESAQLLQFLRKEGLESKTAAELAEMCGFDPAKLRHVIPDAAGFKREVASRKIYLEEIASLDKSGFLTNTGGEPHPENLSAHFPEAKQAATLIREHEKTMREDAGEWELAQEIERKKAILSGTGRNELQKSLQELESLEKIMDGNENIVGKKEAGAEAVQPKKEKRGILGSLLGFFSGK